MACTMHGPETRTHRRERPRRRRPRTFATAPRTRCSTRWWRSTPRPSSHGWGSRARRCRRSCTRSSRVTFVAVGWKRASCAWSAVTFIQRFGSALNLRPHPYPRARRRLHLRRRTPAFPSRCVAGGRGTRAPPRHARASNHAHAGGSRHPASRGIRTSLYSTHGALVAQEYDDEEQLWLDLDRDGEDTLTQLQGASIRYRIAVGPIAGRKTLRLHTPGAACESAQQPKPFTAARDGFSLNAAVACRAGDRRKLERLCRYVARPAIALERVSRDGDGLVVYELKHPFRDGYASYCTPSLAWMSSAVRAARARAQRVGAAGTCAAGS